MNKKFQSALFRPLGRWTGNNFLFKGGLVVVGVGVIISGWSGTHRTYHSTPCIFTQHHTCSDPLSFPMEQT